MHLFLYYFPFTLSPIYFLTLVFLFFYILFFFTFVYAFLPPYVNKEAVIQSV